MYTIKITIDKTKQDTQTKTNTKCKAIEEKKISKKFNQPNVIKIKKKRYKQEEIRKKTETRRK